MSTVLTLTRLERILDAHHRVQQSAGDMLRWALVAGHELARQKSELPHGEWLPWLSSNVPFDERMAQRYMQLDAARGQLEANPTRMSDLSLSGALKLVQKPKEPAPASTSEVLGILRAGGAEAPAARVAVQATVVRDWTDQQTSKFTRALDRLTQATQHTEDARGLSGFGAAEQLRDAAISARHAASTLEELAASF